MPPRQVESASPAVEVVVSTPDQVFLPASAKSSSGISGDYGDYPAARLIDNLVRKKGFKRAYLERVLAWVERQQWILDLVNRSKSKGKGKRSTRPTGAWTRYRAKFVTADNISKGIGFWRRHGAALRRAQARYGVPPEYVVAIIGVETRYGGYLGKHRVIDALATLASTIRAVPSSSRVSSSPF